MKRFFLTGIKPPGKVNLPQIGTIDLEKIDDTLAEKLFLQGVPFIQPVPEKRHELFKDQKPIVAKKFPNPENKKKKSKFP